MDRNWYTRPDDDQWGVILEVDNVHNDLPLRPKSIEVAEPMLSPYCKDSQSIIDILFVLIKKLVSSLNGRSHYVLHHRNLKR